MSNSLKSTHSLRTVSTLTNAGEISTPTDRAAISYATTLLDGTGNGKADQKYSDSRTLTAGATDTFTLDNNSLANGLGGTVSMARLKSITLVNTSTDATADIELTFFGGDEYESLTVVVPVQPGGVAVLVAPNLGFKVVPTTHDHLAVSNLASGAQATYEIVLIGATA